MNQLDEAIAGQVLAFAFRDELEKIAAGGGAMYFGKTLMSKGPKGGISFMAKGKSGWKGGLKSSNPFKPSVAGSQIKI